MRLLRSLRFRLLASELVHNGETRILALFKRQRMPSELVESVFVIFLDHFSDSATPYLYRQSILQPALRAMACVSRHWYIMATGVLYRHIFVASRVALGMLAATMSDRDNEHLPHYVQSLQTGADIFESFHEIDQSDYDERIRCYQTICDACPSLTFADRSRGQGDIGDILDTNYVDISKLTHLDVFLAKNLLCNYPIMDSTCLGSIAVLPAMQELTIRVWKDGSTVHDVQNLERGCVVLPAMPYLRCLSVIGWDDRYARLILFQPSYPSLRVLEFINCSIETLYELPMVREMPVERLVVTGSMRESAGIHHYRRHYRTSYFECCAALTHLCIPLSKSSLRNCTFPRNLRHFLLDGSIDEDEIITAEVYLGFLFKKKAEVSKMALEYMNLQHVHIVSPDVVRKDKSTFKYEWNRAAKAAKKANVTFTVGIEGLQRHKSTVHAEGGWPLGWLMTRLRANRRIGGP